MPDHEFKVQFIRVLDRGIMWKEMTFGIILQDFIRFLLYIETDRNFTITLDDRWELNWWNIIISKQEIPADDSIHNFWFILTLFFMPQLGEFNELYNHLIETYLPQKQVSDSTQPEPSDKLSLKLRYQKDQIITQHLVEKAQDISNPDIHLDYHISQGIMKGSDLKL